MDNNNNNRTEFQRWMDEKVPDWETVVTDPVEQKRLERNYEAYTLYEEGRNVSQAILSYLDAFYSLSIAALQIRAENFENEIQEIKRALQKTRVNSNVPRGTL